VGLVGLNGWVKVVVTLVSCGLLLKAQLMGAVEL
jgi:hypothetical protein